jgi:sugar lactone lactonase YvrE
VRARYVLAAICIVASVGFIWSAMSGTDQEITYGHEPRVANNALGEAKGVYPGRVAWIHDPNSTNWAGIGSGQRWYSDTCTNQQVVNEMLSKALRAMTGKGSDYAAWDAIFRNFNQLMGKGDVGYSPGEKIAVKVNLTLMHNASSSTMEKYSGYVDYIDNSPQLAIALLKQLTDVVGANPNDISIGDPTRIMPNYWYNMVEPNCPNVVYLTKAGYAGSGRTIVTYDYNAPFYWSDPCAAHWSGVTKQDYIPTHFAQAAYFINFPILKSHSGSGITLCGKNHYGSLIRNPDASDTNNSTAWYNMHWSRLGATESPGMGWYRAIVDLMGHPRLGGKTLLALIDGLYAGQNWNSIPLKWQMAPFNNDWPSSIIVSQDQVAADSVGDDFLYTEWTTLPRMSGADDYLHEAALIPDPPSDANYAPNHNGGLIKSLGVHEHWNDANNKQYTRNLDPVNGTGIELVAAPAPFGDFDNNGRVDFRDFALFATAWASRPGDDNWNAACDISIPSDGVINERDLDVFCDNWLKVLVTDLIQPGAELQEVYSASGIFFEGPTWDPNSNRLFFTKRSSGFQILRLDSPGSATVWMNNAPQTNGTLLSLDGRLLTADESIYQIRSHRIGASGPEDTTVLCTAPDKPNDLCQLTNGDIYFTCPDWSSPTNQGVYLLEPNGVVKRVNNGLNQPNGIITSLDETKLYVAESSSSNITYKRWWVFSINADGTLGTGSVFFKPTSPPGTNDPDGMTIDEFGNLYFCGLGGVWIVSPTGQQLDMIPASVNCSNITFGGPNGRTLYITCQDKVYSLAMCVRGGE